MITRNPIRILTVDDHPLLRAGIGALVSSQADMRVVAECSNGRDAIQQFRRHRPDVTLMDLQMPQMSGTDAIIAIRAEFPDARIIALSTYAGDVQALRALHAGARGYLLKNAMQEELPDTIRAVQSGRKTLSPTVSGNRRTRDRRRPQRTVKSMSSGSLPRGRQTSGLPIGCRSPEKP